MKFAIAPRRSGDRFYDLPAIWTRSSCTPTLRARLAFILLSKLYRQMYAGTGISTDSARRKKAKTTARWLAAQTRKIFQAAPMPELQSPAWHKAFAQGLTPRAAMLGTPEDFNILK